MSETIKQSAKKRNWACVVYPESAPENWQERLRQSGLPVAISPLHDKDLEADESTPKKPHWHVILAYSGPQTYKAVKTLTDSLKAPSPIPLEAVRGYYRYFTHADNPEKAQYRAEDIRTLNGFSILDWADVSRSEVNGLKKEILETIRTLELVEYSQLVEWAMADGRPEQFDIVVNNTIFFDRYLSSRRNQRAPKPVRSVGSIVDEI